MTESALRGPGMKKLYLATLNNGKIREMKAALEGAVNDFITPSNDFPLPEIRETGQSFEENAILKAKKAVELHGMASLADDSGLCVDALNGKPGIHSSRFFGPGLDDQEKVVRLLEMLKDVKDPDRTAFFFCAAALYYPSGQYQVITGICRGKLLNIPVGSGGFGYDPIFYIPEKKKTFAQLTVEEKQKISHRGRALKSVRDYLLSEAD